MAQIYLNNAHARLVNNISISATTIELTDVVNFPGSLGAGEWFLLTLYKPTSRYGENIEVVKVTGWNGSQVTVVRGHEGTAKTHAAGELVEARITAGVIQPLYDKMATIEQGAEVNQTNSEIKTQYEANADTNAFTDAKSTKLDGIATGAQVNTVDTVDGLTGAVDLSGNYEAKRLNNLSATTDPTVNNDSGQGYEPLSRWINTSTGEVWLCVSAGVGVANWQKASLTLDELGSAAVVDVGIGASQVPQNSDLGSAAYTPSTDYLGSGAKAADSELLDGLDSSVFQRPTLTNTDGTSQGVPNGDWNDVTKSGFYDASGALNQTPHKTHTWQHGLTIQHNSNYQWQLAKGFNDTDPLSYRVQYAGTWNDWKQVWSEDNFTPANYLQKNSDYAEHLKVGRYFYLKDYDDGDTGTGLKTYIRDGVWNINNDTSTPAGGPQIELGGNRVWHEGNDGSGSTLDADTVDGQHASAFAAASHTHAYLSNTGDLATGRLGGTSLAVTNTSTISGDGLSLYGGNYTGGRPTYGMMFAGTSTFGAHGAVTGNWAVYFTTNDSTDRGWIFSTTSGNVASISASGVLTADGSGLTGTAPSLRAQATTKADVGLANVANVAASEAANASTMVKRDSSGDVHARLLRSEYSVTNSNAAFIMTQINQGSNNYVRPTTPTQFRASVTDAYYEKNLTAGSNITIDRTDPANPVVASTASNVALFQEFTSSGTFTKDPDAEFIYVEVLGAGGSGSSVSSTSSFGGAGSGGGFSKGLFRAADVGTTETVTIGARGERVINLPGEDGGDSSFGTLVTAPGGYGGINTYYNRITMPAGSANPDNVNADEKHIYITDATITYLMAELVNENSGYGGGGNTSPGALQHGGRSVYGGAGGASSAATVRAKSKYAGDGGMVSGVSLSERDGLYPAGGGAAANYGGDSGRGAHGRVRVWQW